MNVEEAATELVTLLAQHYDVPPDRIRNITVTPLSIECQIFAVNDEGKKFIAEGGSVALDTRSLPFGYKVPA